MAQVTEVVKLRRKVITEIAKFAFRGELPEKVSDILTTVVTEEGPRYRCCVHKERAVLKDRINVALSQPLNNSILESAKNASQGLIEHNMPIINVMPEACDECPLDKFLVTDACRNCIAHHCISSCPKKAITVHQNRAYIDKTTCIECGMCKKSCPYGAIIEISRPCERSCDLGAITAGSDRKAVIDSSKCVQCGACKNACPFGAIGERTYIVQIIQQLKSGANVYALVAPAIVGQFGFKVSMGQVFEGLKQLGFADVVEVALGADIIVLEETKEFLETIDDKKFMTTSCCPAFVGMIEKHLPELKDNVSTTVSPMAATARVVKEKNPDSIIVFIGPCTAKKVEALKYTEIDYVITYEELASMMVGAGINVSEIKETQYEKIASSQGNRFAKAGGVLQAIQETAAEISSDSVLSPCRCDGLASCKQVLLDLKAGKNSSNFIEGMGCVGGCVGGPGTLTDYRVTTKLVETHANNSPIKYAAKNEVAQDMISKVHLHR